jgi:pyruvate/2-oxoglutarate dehydrogenase complex dihydrolipoamide dehydrogenase (E3) component
MPKSFDAIVIGTGQCGPPLAVRPAKSGRNVAIRERAPAFRPRRPLLLDREDEDISSATRDILIKEGIKIALNAECIAIQGTDLLVAAGAGAFTHLSYSDYDTPPGRAGTPESEVRRSCKEPNTYTPQFPNSSRTC